MATGTGALLDNSHSSHLDTRLSDEEADVYDPDPAVKTGHPTARWVLQDDWPWNRDVPAAWQLAAAPGLATGRLSPGALEKEIWDLASDARQMDRVAYWTPLLHLTTFGLGWRYPEVGLWRWLSSGMPEEDPVLAAIKHRYGEHADMMAAWLARLGGPSLRAAPNTPTRNHPRTPRPWT